MKKIITDTALFVLMILEYSRVYTSPLIHEIIGVALIFLVILHIYLNRKYFTAIFKGRYNFKRGFNLAVNILFIIVFVLTTLTGIFSSQSLLPSLNIGNLNTVYVHKILGYFCLIILSVHLSLNLTKVFEKLKSKINNNVIFYCLYGILIILGVYCLIDVDFFNHIIGNSGFSIATGNILINSLEYLSIIVMVMAIVQLPDVVSA